MADGREAAACPLILLPNILEQTAEAASRLLQDERDTNKFVNPSPITAGFLDLRCHGYNDKHVMSC